MNAKIVALGFLLSGCATQDTFIPKSQYPPDPWVKGYSDPDDCIGGEKLAARQFSLPDYPKRAFNSGRQGWVIVRLNVNEAGVTENVKIERSVPHTLFDKNAQDAVEAWIFEPTKDGALTNCRVLIRYRFGIVSLGS